MLVDDVADILARTHPLAPILRKWAERASAPPTTCPSTRGSGWNAPTPESKTPPLAERRLDISNNNQPTGFAYMNTLTLSSDAFSFSLSNPAAVEGAFLAHLARFEAQDRDVSWQDAPAAFAFASSDAGVETLTNLFRAAMEDLLDSGEIRVERLAGGGNRLVRASSTETAVTCENTP